MRQLLVLLLSLVATTASFASQLTIGCWDFEETECFPVSSYGWEIDAVAGEGIEDVHVVPFSDGYIGWYICVTGSGPLHLSIFNCLDQENSGGVDFTVEMPDDCLPHFLCMLTHSPIEPVCDYCGVVTEIAPAETVLTPAYPNPFNPTTTIDYSIAEPGHVDLRVFNLQGEEVATLVTAHQGVGDHSATFNAADLPSGIYIYRLQTGNYSAIRKITLVR